MTQRHVEAHEWATWRSKNQSDDATCQPVIRPRQLCRTATLLAESACRTTCHLPRQHATSSAVLPSHLSRVCPISVPRQLLTSSCHMSPCEW
jgi:hypothetical protein